MVWPVGEQALVDFRTGRWQEAHAGALEAERLAIDAGLENEVANNRQLLAWIAAGRGQSAECLRYVGLVLEQAGSSGAVILELLTHGSLGLLELGLSRPAAAVGPLERARALAESTGFREAAHFQWAADLVEAYVLSGRPEEAGPLVDHLTDQADRTDRPIIRALSLRAQGLVDTEDSFDRHFSAALRFHKLAHRPFETARTQLRFGQRLRRGRARATARVQLRAAWEAFSGLGADCWADQTHAELLATGERLPDRARSGADLLTPQELQVARTVRDGASNRQAAERLFLSPKTVEYHLSHVYRKLDIASRADLAAALIRLR
jgi:DNA-binding CsgD family transcriptional regulator